MAKSPGLADRLFRRLGTGANSTPYAKVEDGAPDDSDDESESDAGAGAHRHADVGLGERGCVVDAVAGHRDPLTFALAFANELGLLVRHHRGFYAIDPELLGDRQGGGAVVAGPLTRVPSSRRLP